MIDYTGATAVSLPHRMENDFSFDAEELLSLVNEKTKLIILNSPANPTGGVVPKSEYIKLIKGLEKTPKCIHSYLMKFIAEYYLMIMSILV